MPARVIRVPTTMTLLLSALAIVPAGCGGDEPVGVHYSADAGFETYTTDWFS